MLSSSPEPKYLCASMATSYGAHPNISLLLPYFYYFYVSSYVYYVPRLPTGRYVVQKTVFR